MSRLKMPVSRVVVHPVSVARLAASVLVGVAGGVASAQTSEPAKQPDSSLTPIAAQPTLELSNKGGAFTFNTMVHDWGAIGDEETVKTTFTFKNTSDRIVRINNTKSSCGCSVATPSKQVLQPGEEASIEATYNPKGRRGLELKTITLETDYAPQANVELHLKALVRPRMVVEPSSVWFGDVSLGKGGEQELTILSRMEGFQVTGFTMNDPKFKVELVGADKTEMDGGPVDRVRFKARFNEGSPIGTYSAPMTFTTNDPKNPSYSVTLAGRVVGELMPVPERVFVTMTGAAQAWTGEVTVTSRTGKAFEIYSVEPVDVPDEMKIVVDVLAGTPAQPGARNSARIKVSGVSPAAPNLVRGSVLVRTNVLGMEEFSLPLMAIWRGPMTPSPGAAAPGAPVNMPVTIPVKP